MNQDQSKELSGTSSSVQNNNPIIFQPENFASVSSKTDTLNAHSDSSSIESLTGTPSNEGLNVNQMKDVKSFSNENVVLGDNINNNSSSSMESNIPVLEPIEMKNDQFNQKSEGNNPGITPTVVIPISNSSSVSTVSNGPSMVSTTQPINNSSPNIIPTSNASTVNNLTPRDSVGIINQNKNPNLNGANPMPRENPVENLKKVDVEYKPPGKFKTFLLIVFLVGLILFVMYLPQIKDYVDEFQNRGKTQNIIKITTGSMKCTLQTNSKTLDKNYNLVFYFTDSKLERTEFTITTKGDPTADEEELNQIDTSCKLLEREAENLDGLYVKCSNKSGYLQEIQKYDLSNLDFERLDSVFIEIGANNPEYQYGQNIDFVEQNMNASGYSCKRDSN